MPSAETTFRAMVVMRERTHVVLHSGAQQGSNRSRRRTGETYICSMRSLFDADQPKVTPCSCRSGQPGTALAQYDGCSENTVCTCRKCLISRASSFRTFAMVNVLQDATTPPSQCADYPDPSAIDCSAVSLFHHLPINIIVLPPLSANRWGYGPADNMWRHGLCGFTSSQGGNIQ